MVLNIFKKGNLKNKGDYLYDSKTGVLKIQVGKQHQSKVKNMAKKGKRLFLKDVNFQWGFD